MLRRQCFLLIQAGPKYSASSSAASSSSSSNEQGGKQRPLHPYALDRKTVQQARDDEGRSIAKEKKNLRSLRGLTRAAVGKAWKQLSVLPVLGRFFQNTDGLFGSSKGKERDEDE